MAVLNLRSLGKDHRNGDLIAAEMDRLRKANEMAARGCLLDLA